VSDPSDSAILDTRFPGYAWMPRWTRKYWTPSTALAFAVFLLSAGNWWGTYKTAPDVAGLRKELAPVIAATSAECVGNGCLLKKSDISQLEWHVDQLWKQKTSIDAEMGLTIKPIPAPQPAPPALPARRHK